MEIKLTVNGNRGLPFDIPDELVPLMSDENSEFSIVLIASPTARETQADQTEAPTFKVKALHIESIISNV